jgi:DNA-binding transcriptional ArsR family regulator
MTARWLRYGLILGLGLAAALLALAPPAPAAELDAGGRSLLLVTIEARDIVSSGESLSVVVHVSDGFGHPVPHATVYIQTEFGTALHTVFTGADGRARFTYTAVSTRLEEDVVTITAYKAGFESSPSSVAELRVAVVPPTRKPVDPAPAVGVSVGAAALAAVSATEAGRLGLFNLVLFPLYSRLRREEVLDHFVRGQIYGYIQSHPGEHYNKMRDDLKITNGTLSHHLRTLEMQGFVKSKRDGIFRRFYPVEMEIPQEHGLRLSDLQIRLVDLLRDTAEGIPQSDLALLLGVSQQTISYNLRVLGREGIVRAVRSGRLKRYYVMTGLDA